jgi:hypothetical protein
MYGIVRLLAAGSAALMVGGTLGLAGTAAPPPR